MIDHFHLEKYGTTAVNYNRDLETFPVLKEILHRITGKTIYYSPTDMGVNVIGECITDDKAIRRAAKNESFVDIIALSLISKKAPSLQKFQNVLNSS